MIRGFKSYSRRMTAMRCLFLCIENKDGKRMAKKKKNGDGLYFVGQSSIDVTGSQYLVKFMEYQCLLECGLHQSSSNDYLDSYRVNSRKFQFNPSEIDFVFICHSHIDHIGLLPRLVKEGFHGEIICTFNTSKIMKPLLMNCAYIIQDEARVLSKRYHREYKPLFDEGDVLKTMSLIHVYDEYNIIKNLNDKISFQWLKNSHCVGAAQLQLILRDKLRTRKILYTSDIGALHTKNHYVDDTEIPDTYSDITIMESTYGSDRRISNKTRGFDLEHLRVAIKTVLGRKGSIVMPCFSFSRTQELLTNLFILLKDDKDFKAQVIVDSKLSCEINDIYGDILTDEDAELWRNVSSWDKVKFIEDKESSQENLLDNTPKIILSSSGFCTNGRIINYLKKYLKDENSMIIFSGYVGDNPSYLSYRIKNFSNRLAIKINKEEIPNRADCITLSTFSSHANHDDLITYGSSLNTSKLILVHGSDESKKCLAEKLKQTISKNNRTYRVVCANKDMVIHL